LHLSKSLPPCFNGIVRSPECGDACLLCFELGACDGPVSCAEMCEHCCNGDIGKDEGVVIQGGKIEVVDGHKKLFFISSCTVVARMSSAIVDLKMWTALLIWNCVTLAGMMGLLPRWIGS